MKRRQILTIYKANRRMQVGTTARVILVGAIATGFLAWHPKAVMAANRDRLVAAFETAQQEHEPVWKPSEASKQNLNLPSQKQAVSGVREQNSRDITLIKTLREHNGFVNGVSFSANGQTLVSSSGDGTIKLWKPDGTLLKTLSGRNAYVNKVCISPDGQTLAVGSF